MRPSNNNTNTSCHIHSLFSEQAHTLIQVLFQLQNSVHPSRQHSATAFITPFELDHNTVAIMRVSSYFASAIAAFAAIASAQNPFTYPVNGDTIQAGEVVNLKWTPSTQGTVSLFRRSGNPGALSDPIPIASKSSKLAQVYSDSGYTVAPSSASTTKDESSELTHHSQHHKQRLILLDRPLLHHRRQRLRRRNHRRLKPKHLQLHTSIHDQQLQHRHFSRFLCHHDQHVNSNVHRYEHHRRVFINEHDWLHDQLRELEHAHKQWHEQCNEQRYDGRGHDSAGR